MTLSIAGASPRGFRFAAKVSLGDSEPEKSKFRRRYLEADLVIFDDLQLVDDFSWIKTRAQLRFFLKERAERKAFVMLTSTRPPETFGFEPELKSQLRRLIAFTIKPPDYKLMMEILLKKAELKDFELNAKFAEMIIERLPLDLRSIEHAIDKLAAWAKITKSRLDELDEPVIKELFGEHRINPRVDLGAVRREVAEYYGLSPEELKRQGYTTPLMIIILLGNEVLNMNAYELGAALDLDAANASALLRRAKNQKKESFHEDMDKIRERLSQI